MTGTERGFLLLTSHLGDPDRPVLTVAQFRTLADRMLHAEWASEERELRMEDLISLGYGRERQAESCGFCRRKTCCTTT